MSWLGESEGVGQGYYGYFTACVVDFGMTRFSLSLSLFSSICTFTYQIEKTRAKRKIVG